MTIDENRIQFLMRKLNITREEALDLEGYDQDVNKGRKTQYDLTPEQVRNVQEMVRKTDHKKTGTTTHTRKPDDIKIGIMAALQDYFANEFELDLNDEVLSCKDVVLTNTTRMLHFKIKDREFDLQLIGKRNNK